MSIIYLKSSVKGEPIFCRHPVHLSPVQLLIGWISVVVAVFLFSKGHVSQLL